VRRYRIHRPISPARPASRFVKIRHFGLTSSGNVNTKLQCARTLLPASPPILRVPPPTVTMMAKVHHLPARSIRSFLACPTARGSLARMSNYVLAASNARLCDCAPIAAASSCPAASNGRHMNLLGSAIACVFRAAMAIALPAAVRACCRRWWLHDLRLVGDDNQVSCPRKKPPRLSIAGTEAGQRSHSRQAAAQAFHPSRVYGNASSGAGSTASPSPPLDSRKRLLFTDT